MSFITGSLKNYFHLTVHQLVGLQKKNDDLGIVEIERWIKSHPINTKLENFSKTEIEACVEEIIKTLKEIPITSSNMCPLEEHLIKIARESDRVRELLIEKIRELKIHPEVIRSLNMRLNFVYTEKA